MMMPGQKGIRDLKCDKIVQGLPRCHRCLATRSSMFFFLMHFDFISSSHRYKNKHFPFHDEKQNHVNKEKIGLLFQLQNMDINIPVALR